jgi:hypothetical protein
MLQNSVFELKPLFIGCPDRTFAALYKGGGRCSEAGRSRFLLLFIGDREVAAKQQNSQTAYVKLVNTRAEKIAVSRLMWIGTA